MHNRQNFIQGFKDEMQTVIQDHSVLLTVLVAPLVYVFLMGSIYYYKEVNKIPFAVVDDDKTPTSQKFTQLLSADPTIRLVNRPATYKEAVNEMFALKVQGFLIFPKGFEKSLLKGEGSDVKLYLNTTRFLPSNDLNRAVNTVFQTIGAGIRVHYYATKGINKKYAMQRINPVMAEVHPIYNSTNNYGDYLLPALLFFILQQTLLIGLSESFVRSREKGILQNILSRDSIGIAAYFSGKLSYYLLLYAAYVLLFLGVIFRFFDLPIRGDKIAIFTLSVLFLIVVMVYSLLIASFSKKQIRIMEVLAFTSYPLFLLSGYSWPISAMPAPLQWLAAIIPTTPMMDAVTKLFSEGSSWWPVLSDFRQLLIMLVVSLVFLYLRMIFLKRKMVTNQEKADIRTI